MNVHVVIGLAVCLSLHLSVNFKLAYDLWPIPGTEFVFGMHIPWVQHFQKTLTLITLWHLICDLRWPQMKFVCGVLHDLWKYYSEGQGHTPAWQTLVTLIIVIKYEFNTFSAKQVTAKQV